MMTTTEAFEQHRLVICTKGTAKEKAKKYGIANVLSICDPHKASPFGYNSKYANDRNLKVIRFDDEENQFKFGCPTFDQCVSIVDWLSAVVDEPVLIHCNAGVSRSTAAGVALLALRGETNIPAIMNDLRGDAARPNILMCEYFDDIINMGGELVEVAEEIRRSSKYRQG